MEIWEYDISKGIFTNDLKNKKDNIYGPDYFDRTKFDTEQYYNDISKDLLSIIAIKVNLIPGKGLALTGDYCFVHYDFDTDTVIKNAGERKTRIYRLTAATSHAREFINMIQTAFNDEGMNNWMVLYYDETTSDIIGLNMKPFVKLYI